MIRGGTQPYKIPCSLGILYRLTDHGIKRQTKSKWEERLGTRDFRRNLRKLDDMYPNFETEFGHLEEDTIVEKTPLSR